MALATLLTWENLLSTRVRENFRPLFGLRGDRPNIDKRKNILK
jgi:hypothetical protein